MERYKSIFVEAVKKINDRKQILISLSGDMERKDVTDWVLAKDISENNKNTKSFKNIIEMFKDSVGENMSMGGIFTIRRYPVKGWTKNDGTPISKIWVSDARETYTEK